MTKKQFEKFKKKMIASIETHIEYGGSLVARMYLAEAVNCKCPIAILVNDKPNIKKSYEDRLTKILGFKFLNIDMKSFINGYDNINMKYEVDDNIKLYKFGQSLRKKYPPLTKAELKKLYKKSGIEYV